MSDPKSINVEISGTVDSIAITEITCKMTFKTGEQIFKEETFSKKVDIPLTNNMRPAGLCEIAVVDYGEDQYILKIRDPANVFKHYAKDRCMRDVDLLTHVILTARSDCMRSLHGL